MELKFAIEPGDKIINLFILHEAQAAHVVMGVVRAGFRHMPTLARPGVPKQNEDI